MKRSDLSKAIGAVIIAAGLALAPAHLHASAQTDTTGGTTGGSNTTTTTGGSDVASADANRSFDWGWLGLLGLSGLFGLIPRKREENVRYTATTGDRDPAVRTDYR